MKDWPHPLHLDWAANGKAVFVSQHRLVGPLWESPGVTLLRVDLDGNAKPIWESASAEGAVGIASPDGRYLAINVFSAERNAWMIENF